MTYTADIQLGDEVLVMGLGAIGLMSIPLARMTGASRIYAVNRSGGKRAEVATHLGADEVILTDNIQEVAFRKGGVDRALVSAPPSVLPSVMKCLNFGGVISYIGIEIGEGAVISFDANDFHFNKTQLRASHATPALYFPLVLQLMKDGHVDGDALISHTMPLEDIGKAIDTMQTQRESVLKIVITP
jgi:L-iditol 2-dehydrogenase